MIIQDEIMINIEDFMSWLNVHKLGINLRYDEHQREQDLGYIKACEVIEAELKRCIEESKHNGT